MITNFEEITHELTPKEVNIILPLVAECLQNAVGKDSALTNHKIAVKLRYENGIIISSPRIRKIIHEIRVNHIVRGLLATSKGYYISNDISEIQTYIASLIQRNNSVHHVINALKDDCVEIYSSRAKKSGKGLFDKIGSFINRKTS